jgi:transposase
LRALTRARRDVVQTRAAARQRLHDELVVLFPAFVLLLRQLPGDADLGAPAAMHLLEAYPSAAALAQTPDDAVLLVAQQASNGRWGEADVAVLQQAARRSAASSRAVAARSLVVRTFVGQVLHLHPQIAELEAAMQEVLRDDADSQRLQGIPGIGPQGAATIRAELGDVLRFSRVDVVVAYAGLDPRTCQSGAFVGQKHLSKRGPGALRHALYLAALVAARCAPEWRVRYHRLLERARSKAAQYHRIAARRGKKRALIAVGHSVLVIIYHLLTTREPYHDLGAQYFDERERGHLQHRLVHRLERLGYAVTLETATALS